MQGLSAYAGVYASRRTRNSFKNPGGSSDIFQTIGGSSVISIF
jgi:hypothetical protein